MIDAMFYIKRFRLLYACENLPAKTGASIALWMWLGFTPPAVWYAGARPRIAHTN